MNQDLLNEEMVTSLVQGLTTNSYKSKGLTIFRCNQRRCKYKVICEYVPSQRRFKVTRPIDKHDCEMSLNKIKLNRRKKCSVDRVKRFKINHRTMNNNPARFSNSQLQLIEKWIESTSWESRKCALPSAVCLRQLQSKIGKSPSLSGFFQRRIQQHIGSKIAVYAWHFDDPNEKTRWSKEVFRRNWDNAMCHGTITGISMNEGFVTCFEGVYKTKTWYSVVDPAIIKWVETC